MTALKTAGRGRRGGVVEKNDDSECDCDSEDNRGGQHAPVSKKNPTPKNVPENEKEGEKEDAQNKDTDKNMNITTTDEDEDEDEEEDEEEEEEDEEDEEEKEAEEELPAKSAYCRYRRRR